MYAKASPFSLALAMLVRGRSGLSLLSELQERSQKQKPPGRVNRSCKMVDMFNLDRILHCNGSLLVANLGFAYRQIVVVLHLPT